MVSIAVLNIISVTCISQQPEHLFMLSRSFFNHYYKQYMVTSIFSTIPTPFSTHSTTKVVLYLIDFVFCRFINLLFIEHSQNMSSSIIRFIYYHNKSLFVKQDMPPPPPPPPPPRCFVSHCDLDLYLIDPLDCDLDLNLIDPKIDREHLLSMTNVCIKFEKAEPYQTVVIDRIRLNKTDRLTDRQVQSNKPPLLRRGGHNYWND